MTAAEAIIARIKTVGGELGLNGYRIRCRVPEHATGLLAEVRHHRDEILCALRELGKAPAIPAGARLISWNLKEAPVRLDACSVVTDTLVFAQRTLTQFRVALTDPRCWVGWSVPELVDRLTKVGVIVELDHSENSKV